MHHGRPYRRRFDVAPRQAVNGNSTSVVAEGLGTASASEAAASTSFSSSSSLVTEIPSTSSDQTSQTETISSSTISSVPTSSAESSTSSIQRTSSTISTTTSSSVSRSSTSVSSSKSASSSSSIVTPGTLLLSNAPVPTPATTLIITAGPPSDTPTSVIGTYTFSPSATKEPVSGLANGFWQNTGAVAGTFTALGVFVLGIIVAFVVLRKRRARRTQSEDEFFENFAVTSNDGAHNSAHAASSHDHTMSPEPSFAELAAQAPMDAYSENHMNTIHHGPNYPPSTSYGFAPIEGVNMYPDYSNPQMSQQRSFPVTSQEQLPQNYYIPPPTHAVHGQQAGPRGSYQRSIDSFYGAS